tara:strand:- start:3711 stop:4118 length:408 start_codon:yes stop_codon:yes gene_type:complete
MARDGKYSINLSWYNTLGGIELFNFVARKSYGYKIGKATTAQRDVFNDWSNDFSGTETDTIDIQANETITVRSQNLTEQQINAIAQIKISPKVTDEDQNKTVTINRNSFTYRTDHDKRFEIEFILTYPNIIIPTL